PILIIGAIGVQTIGCSSDGDGGGTQSGVSSSSGGDNNAIEYDEKDFRISLVWESEHDLYLAYVTPSGDTVLSKDISFEENGIYEIWVHLRTDSHLDDSKYHVLLSYGGNHYAYERNISDMVSGIAASRSVEGESYLSRSYLGYDASLGERVVKGFVGFFGFALDASGIGDLIRLSYGDLVPPPEPMSLEEIMEKYYKLVSERDKKMESVYSKCGARVEVQIVGAQGKLAEIQGCPNVFLFDGESIVDLTGGSNPPLTDGFVYCDRGGPPRELSQGGGCTVRTVADCAGVGGRAVSSCPIYPEYTCVCSCYSSYGNLPQISKTVYSAEDCPGISSFYGDSVCYSIVPDSCIMRFGEV
ncbi:MAG: hypothetical protein FWH22_10110, partial [Fibromonadales bacterium]|nr:hypothetical protein [Fibromonadales bacterium]